MKQERNKDKGSILIRYVKSFKHACDGIIYACKYEHNIIIMICATILVTILGLCYNINSYEWLFVLLCIGCIISTELINSSIEATIDLVTKDIHPLAKIAKDTAAAASLILCIISLIGGLIIFIPKIF